MTPVLVTSAVALAMSVSAFAPEALAATRAAKPRGKAEARARPAATPDPSPDGALYREATDGLAALKASPRKQAQRAEWERVVLRFRRVIARYPQSGYCDNSLLAIGDMYRMMAKRFSSPRYEDDAVQAYRALVAEYPSSRLGEKALYSAFEMARESTDRARIGAAAREYLDAFPNSARAAEVKAQTRRRVSVQEADLPSPPPPGLAQVFNLRFWSGETSTRVVLDLEHEVKIRSDRIRDPDRLWLDLAGTRLHPNLSDRAFPVGDGLLKQVRIGQNRDDVVRVVLDFKDVKDYSFFYLQNPTRLVVDVRATPRPLVASGNPASTPAAGAPPRSLAPASSPAPPEAGAERMPARRVAPVEGPAVAASGRRAPAWDVVIDPSAANPRPTAPSPPPSGARTARAEPVAPLLPQANRAGSYSLARQLGLGARRIVIDAGHGGHDPGTIGPGGVQEKDVVLDVALRVERLVRRELGAEVVMTRSTDVFIPLEERTAIANSKGADLFLSIHANSSRNPRAKGIETYFLNFAADSHAEAVAARENAISAATLKDLQNLVRAIALNSKVDESRDFAASVQEAMVENMRPHDPEVQDRGVHTAPFYVLIGANMPSILAEIAFLSHPEDEKRLKKADYRERVAASLLEGVRGYLDALNRTQSRQLTQAPRKSTVASGEDR
ncbi:MAG TPA: N-acetylmuramoyl-L-alanine amidase [Vicinamibacteria bacterium]